MAKKRKIIIAGEIVEDIIYTAPEPRDGPRARAEKSRMTTAAQKCMNDKSAKKNLSRLISTNFTRRDLFITLTYSPEALPEKRTEAKEHIRRFFRLLRAHRKARGAGLKYIYVTEDKHGEGRLHHHMIINAVERDLEAIRSLWSWGEIIDLQYLARKDYDGWALYMTKESGGRPNGARMWTGSRNLKKPIIRSWYVPNDQTIETPLGVHILQRREERNEFGSYCYVQYRRLPGYSSPDPLHGTGENKPEHYTLC